MNRDEIVSGHQKFIGSISGSLETLNACSDLISKVLHSHSQFSRDEFTVSLIGFRIINDIGAARVLADHSFFVPFVALLRDLVEIAALSLDFAAHPKRIGQWERLSGKERYRRFKLSRILQEINGKEKLFLQSRFDAFSELGTHPSVASFRFYINEAMVEAGPHINARNYVRAHQDLASVAWHTTDAAGRCWTCLTKTNISADFPIEQARYKSCFGKWNQDCVPT